MALDFPANPVDGEVFGSYVWSASKGVWQSREESAAVAITSPTAPLTANNGDIWYNTARGIAYVYYDDGSSSQWVEVVTSGTPELATKADVTYVDSQDSLKANLSGASFTGQINSSYGGTTNRFNVSNTTAGTEQYTNAINISNDTGYKVIHFLNSSTRTVDGGANGYTIRNDGGPISLGNSSYNTAIYGKVTMPQQPVYSGTLQYASGNATNFYPVTYDTFITGFSKSGNNRLTSQVAGKYYVAAQQLINGGSYLCIYKNGVEVAHAYAASDDTYDMNVSALIDLQVNDYVEIYYHGGSGLSYAWGDAHSRYSVFKVS
jgi:hypothetical protein